MVAKCVGGRGGKEVGVNEGGVGVGFQKINIFLYIEKYIFGIPIFQRLHQRKICIR